MDVGGERFCIERSLLQRYPRSRLARLMRADTVAEILRLCEEFTPGSPPEYFFDRNPDRFPVILNMYRIKELHMNLSGCPVIFQKELEYWMIDEDDMEPCCSIKYYEEVNVCQKEKEEDIENDEKAKEKAGEENFGETRYGKIRYFIWSTLEYPSSSLYAQVWGAVSLLFVILSTVLFFLETLLDNDENDEDYMDHTVTITILKLFDVSTMIFFTIEYVLKLVTCPSISSFIVKPLNIIDFLTLIPFYLGIILQQLQDFQVIGKAGKMVRLVRILRVMRLLKLLHHMHALDSLLFVLKKAQSELVLVQMMVIITILAFACLLYSVENSLVYDMIGIAENCTGWKKNITKDIYLHPCYVWTLFDSFWISLMNITTVGKAMPPQSYVGKLVAGLCTILGVFIFKLPVPIIVNSFARLYDIRKRRTKQASKRKEKKDKIMVILSCRIIANYTVIFQELMSPEPIRSQTSFESSLETDPLL